MKPQRKARDLFRRKSEAGTTLIETLIALAVLFIVSVSMMALAVAAIKTTENQGHLASRTAEYASDKMEQLLALAYTDAASNTAVFPTAPAGGQGLTIGGSADPSSPVAGYVDYLDVNGNLLQVNETTPVGNWYYIRVWQISAPAGTTHLKQITVTSRVSYMIATGRLFPQSTVVTLKSDPL
ncbi:MAG: hypothetical protein LAN71_17950 [Acidobacteriia bacterium]|nr:hypothetical protein [Terriglobia bacterium]